MANSSFKISDFLGVVRSSQTQRSDRFEISFFPPSGIGGNTTRLASILCEEAQVPGLSATVQPLRVGAWTEQRVKNLEFLGDEFVFTFVCDEGWGIRGMMEDWMNYISNPTSKELAFPSDYMGKVKIATLNTKDEITASWMLYDAFPKLLNVVPVSSSNPGVIRLSCTFASTWWERE